MSSSYDKTLAYRAERQKLVDASVYTMAMAIAECEAEEKAAKEREAKAAEPHTYTFEVRDPKTGAVIGKRVVTYNSETELREKLARQTKELRLQLNWDKFSEVPATAQRAETNDYDESESAKVARDVDEFLATTPGYTPTQSNFDAIATFIGTHSLRPTLQNFRIAYEALSKAGLFVDANGVPIQPTTGPVKPYRPGDEITYQMPNGGRLLTGREAVENMDMHTYRSRLLNEKGFAAKVERLLSEKR